MQLPDDSLLKKLLEGGKVICTNFFRDIKFKGCVYRALVIK